MISLNNTVVNPTVFPDGTSQVWKLSEEALINHKSCYIDWKFESESELFHIMQLVELIKKYSFRSKIILRMNYFPYARQDKNISNTSTFALIPFLKFLDNLKVDVIESFDVHSDVPRSLLKTEFINVSPVKEIRDTIKATGVDLICFPDQGAEIRYKDLVDINYVTLKKKRDQLTGKLSFSGISHKDCTSVYDMIDLSGSNILIVDDLCDGGGTFIMASDILLKTCEADKTHLYTSHGIYSKGTSILFKSGISRVFNKDGEVLTRT